MSNNVQDDSNLIAKLDEILDDIQSKSKRKDLGNSTNTPLVNGGTFTGTPALSDGMAAISAFIVTDQPLSTARLVWSEDGNTANTDFLAVADYTVNVTEVGGFYVYYPDPQTYLLDGYYWLELENTSGTDQTVLQAFLWTFPLGSQPFTFLDPDGVPSTLSKALLTKAINPALVINQWTDEVDGTIPSGSAITIDPVLNTEPNVLDSGWISTATFSGKNIVRIGGDVGLIAYLMNASDDQGSNIFGDGAPTLSTNAGFPAQLSALYPDNYYRIVVVNVSGSPLTDYSISSRAAPESMEGVTTSLDQPVFDFFPANVVRSVGMGKSPDGDYGNLTKQGIHSANSSSILLNAGEVYRGVWREWLSSEVELISTVTSDVSGTLYVDVSDVESPVDGNDSSVQESFPLPYDPSTSALARRTTPVQSRWVRHRYVNGNAGQSVFQLNAGMLVTASGLVKTDLATLPGGTNLAGIVRAVSAITDGNGGYQEIPVDSSGTPKVSVESIGDDVSIAPLPNWHVRQATVSSTAALLDTIKLATRRAVQIKNHDSENSIWIGHDENVSPANGELIDPKGVSGMRLSAAGNIYGVTASGGTTTVTNTTGSSATGTATTPSNVLTSNNSRAIFDAVGETVTVSGLSTTATDPVVSLVIGAEGRRAATPASQTVSWLSPAVTNTNTVGTVTAPNVPAGTDVLYVAAISVTATNFVTGVEGGGLTWAREDGAAVSSKVRTSIWYAYGSPTTTFDVVASLNEAGRSNIAVHRFSGVDPVTPFESTASFQGTASDLYSDSIDCTANGIQFLSVAYTNHTHSPGSGATERSETSTGTGTNTVSLATTTKSVSVTGSTVFSGTLSGADDWAVLATSIRPAATTDPTLELKYTLSGVPGTTTGVLTFNSTSDESFIDVDITADREWVVADVPNINLIAEALTVPVNIELDHLYLQITYSSGVVVRVSIKQIADE